SHLHLLGQLWDVEDGRLIMTNGWSSMGFGPPAAIAAALAGNGEQILCITGDGGFLMHAGEIMTVRRLGLKIIMVVLSDGELNLIRVKQSWKSVDPYGVQVSAGSLFGANSFLGVAVKRVTDETALRSAVTRALRHDESTIIEAVIDPSLYGDIVVRS
ncbi:MAG: thiamine pyrophosphate-dependent enzyme, partial [Bacteroidales bacterium]|nr:thiamine pyrophosphate-dependent enzyme [Bacteroidales bacterium]